MFVEKDIIKLHDISNAIVLDWKAFKNRADELAKTELFKRLKGTSLESKFNEGKCEMQAFVNQELERLVENGFGPSLDSDVIELSL